MTKRKSDRSGFASIGERIEAVLTPVRGSEAPQTPSVTAKVPNKGGRPRKISKMSIEDAENAIAAELPKLLERLNDLAMGVIVYTIEAHEEEDPDTGETRFIPEARVYRMPPDKDALKYLTERVMGRVPQRVELSGKIDETLKVVPWMPRDEAEKRKLVGPVVRRLSSADAAQQIIDGEARELDG